jgi:hypothetical protein
LFKHWRTAQLGQLAYVLHPEVYLRGDVVAAQGSAVDRYWYKTSSWGSRPNRLSPPSSSALLSTPSSPTSSPTAATTAHTRTFTRTAATTAIVSTAGSDRQRVGGWGWGVGGEVLTVEELQELHRRRRAAAQSKRRAEEEIQKTKKRVRGVRYHI